MFGITNVKIIRPILTKMLGKLQILWSDTFVEKDDLITIIGIRDHIHPITKGKEELILSTSTP
ncbi:hypothetical protein SAMN02745746_00723 [Pseudogulbenkiania subflava DSM 22618]|uniref:Uncharacterized protein n=1 Tax=Pseudogulbenkiania subflava DSM 22618 TaxID=1123014 RepID=A0A1Y6BBR2_9NEIS|nr:hypothetical protein SAMN02745746_00723 [Pseudogulbenkiania subflava DSM 22618]